MQNFVWKLDTWSMSHCFGASQVPKTNIDLSGVIELEARICEIH